MAAEASPDQIYRFVSSALDVAFYRSVYEDVAEAGVDPVRHYLDAGWREGRDPAPWFSTQAYWEHYPDLQGQDPFHHYLSRGWREGRVVVASCHHGRFGDPEAAQVPVHVSDAGLTLEAARNLLSDDFDAAYYLAANPDVAQAGSDPLDHFLSTGWWEGRDPSRSFRLADYLELNPDIARAGINPLIHYVQAGRAEGRQVGFDLGFRYPTLARLDSLEARIAQASARVPDALIGEPEWLMAALGLSRCRDGALHISLSHDDYTAHVGGVQLCLALESAALAGQFVDHLHIYPSTPWPVIRPDGMSRPLGVVWNGRNLGLFSFETIHAALETLKARSGDGRRSFALHSLLGHNVPETLALLKAAGLKRGYFWLHDFASLCAGYHLMRDEVADCGAPPADSAACGICVFGPGRASHVTAHAELFANLDLTVIAPSRSAYETWRKASTAPSDQPYVILPHARLEPAGPAIVREGSPLVVGFVGMPATHKGWPVFAALAEQFADDGRYRFLHLGSTPVPGAANEFQEISVSAERPRAMREALEAQAVDVAVIWSLCRETFSFAAYEAVAAGAAILTGPDSGNVAAYVLEGDHGRVLPDESALVDLFKSGDVLALSRQARRPQVYDMIYSAMTVDVLEAPR